MSSAVSPGSGSGVEEGVPFSYTFTLLDPRRAKFEWNLVHPETCQAYAINSPRLFFGENHWAVRIFPQGYRREEDKEFLSIFLYIEEGPEQKVHYTIQVLGSWEDCLSYDIAPRAKPGVGWGLFKFMHHRSVGDLEEGWCRDGALRLIITMQVLDAEDDLAQEFANGCCVNDEERSLEKLPILHAKCIVCRDRPQTSGFLHEGECHKCICEQCAQQLHGQIPGLLCPICKVYVDRIIYKFF